MITDIIKQLQSADWLGCGECIEIAKGKFEIPKTWRDTRQKVNREKHMLLLKTQNNISEVSYIKKIKQWLLKSR